MTKTRFSSHRRTKFEIWSEIIEACTRPRTKTWLKNHLGLKSRTLNQSLEFLLARELLEEINEFGMVNFGSTKKGVIALQKYYDLISGYFIPTSNKTRKSD